MLSYFSTKVVPSIKSSLMKSKYFKCFVSVKKLIKYYGSDFLDLSWLEPDVISIRVLNRYILDVNFYKNLFKVVSIEEDEYKQIYSPIDLDTVELDSIEDWDSFISSELVRLSNSII